MFHEVFSFSNEKRRHEILNAARRYDYIIVRDMTFSYLNMPIYDKLIVINKLRKEYDSYKNNKIDYNSDRGFAEFLLKYHYQENWVEELKEYYFAGSHDIIQDAFSQTHELIYFDLFTLPFIRDKIKKDTGIEIKHPTHYKMILKKRID